MIACYILYICISLFYFYFLYNKFEWTVFVLHPGA